MIDYSQLLTNLNDSNSIPQGKQFMKEYLTTEQASNFLQVHPQTVRQYSREGRILKYKFAGNVRFKYTDLVKFVEKNRVIPDMNWEAVKRRIRK